MTVRIAKTRPCDGGEFRLVVIQVLPGSSIKINEENLPERELERRLEELFRTRVYRYVFVVGDPSVTFGDVAGAIDRASKVVDHVVIVTPSVDRQARVWWQTGMCLDANLPLAYIKSPPRR
jgi:hypothetical protein